MGKFKHTNMLCRSAATALSASTLALAFVAPHFSFLGLVSLILIIYLLSLSDHLKLRQMLLQNYLFGVIFFSVVMTWMYGIHATDLIANSFFANFFKAVTLLLVVSIFALGFVLAGWLYRQLKITAKNSSLLFLPAIWAIAEYARSVFFSIFFMGPGGSIGPYWNFGSIGLTVSGTPLKYAGRLVGMFGLSFLIVLLAVTIFKLFQKKYNYAYLLLIPLLAALVGFTVYRNTSDQAIKVQTVGLGSDVESGYQSDLKNKLAMSGSADLTVLPEYSYYFVDSGGKTTNRVLPSNAGLIVDSKASLINNGTQNQLTFYRPNGDQLNAQGKTFLIPGGEYVPYIYQYILALSGNSNILKGIESDRSIDPAQKREQPFRYSDVSYGALACSGAIAPNQYKLLANTGANVLINSASISTLGVSNLYYRQAESMAKFIAASNAKPFIQSARGGPSYVLNQDGKTTSYLANPRQLDVISASVKINSHKTVYTKYGEVLLPLSVLVLAFRFLSLKLNKKNKKT